MQKLQVFLIALLEHSHNSSLFSRALLCHIGDHLLNDNLYQNRLGVQILTLAIRGSFLLELQPVLRVLLLIREEFDDSVAVFRAILGRNPQGCMLTGNFSRVVQQGLS